MEQNPGLIYRKKISVLMGCMSSSEMTTQQAASNEIDKTLKQDSKNKFKKPLPIRNKLLKNLILKFILHVVVISDGKVVLL